MKRMTGIGFVVMCLVILGLAIAVVLADTSHNSSSQCRPTGYLPPYPAVECLLYVPHLTK